VFSFYAAQFLGKVCATAFSAVSICTTSLFTFQLMNFLFNVFFFGIVNVGTNILSHRYMLEKASTINALTYGRTEGRTEGNEWRKEVVQEGRKERKGKEWSGVEWSGVEWSGGRTDRQVEG
jgi:hypothetical protein